MFYITYWDNDLEKQIKIGKLTHEQAIIKQIRLGRKGHTNIQINLK